MPALPPETDLFDALRSGWQQENSAPNVDLDRLSATAETELRQQHRRHKRATIGMSLSFVAAIAVTTWIYLRFDDHGPFFYGAIIVINLLMIFMAVIMWLGVQHEQSTSSLTSLAHIHKTIKRLQFRRFAIVYASPVYMLLLLAALMFYYADVLATASVKFKAVAYSLTIAYVVLMYVLTRRKRNKTLAQINKLLAELRQLESVLQTA